MPHLRHFRPTHRVRAVPARHSKWKWAVLLYKKKSNGEVANSRQITMQKICERASTLYPGQMTDRRRRLITLCRCENWRCCDGSNSLLEIFQLLPFASELAHEGKISHTTQASKKERSCKRSRTLFGESFERISSIERKRDCLFEALASQFSRLNGRWQQKNREQN